MAISNFIPTIWSASILERLNDFSAFMQIADRKYEGDLNVGDRVKINELGAVSVNSYTRNSTSDITWEFLTEAQQELVIDQAKYFAFAVDDVDAVQAKPSVMAEAMKNSAWALKNNIDEALAAEHANAGLTYGSTGSAIDVNSNSIFKVMTRVSAELDQTNTPPFRWAVVPAWFFYALVSTKIDKDKGTDRKTLQRGGFQGQFFGYDIYVSNNVVNGLLSSGAASNAKCMFGSYGSIALAVQVNKIEAVRPSLKFHDLVKGLLVYGYKVVRPSNLCVATCDYTAESTS